MLSGILPVYKEKGFTSFDVVAKLRGILGIRRIGHTGTLDPDAEGVLPVCIGSATKLVELLTDSPKEYEAGMIFGISTDTQDISGTVLKTVSAGITDQDLNEAVDFFRGSYDQIPPMYSALKVGGKKLYELAREGKTVERKPRRVHIYDLEIMKSELSADPPCADIRVKCSKGTYIRTLINDIGERLGCGACMKTLIRTEAAGFTLKDCLRLEEIESGVREMGAEALVIPVERVFEEYPKVNVKTDFDRLLYNGNALLPEAFETLPEEGELLRVYDSRGGFKAVYVRAGEIYKIRYIF